jgi:hypothetical protein
VKFETTKYEHSVLRKRFLKTAVLDRGSISLVFWCPYFESRFPTVNFQISEMPIGLVGAGTDRLPGSFQLPTPDNSIGPSEVARDCFNVGWIRLPLVGGRCLNKNATHYRTDLSQGACVALRRLRRSTLVHESPKCPQLSLSTDIDTDLKIRKYNIHPPKSHSAVVLGRVSEEW